MDCPVCSIPLIVVERNEIELDYCISCKGIWFDAGELALLSEALDLSVNIPNIMDYSVVDVKEHVRKCPRCSKVMDKVQMENMTVVLDRCPLGEGLWFDEGELGRLLDGQKNQTSQGDKEIISFLGETFRS